MVIVRAQQSPFIHVLTCLQLPSLTAFPFLPDPLCRSGPPGLEPVWGLSGPADLGRRRRRRGSRLSRVPETEWPVSSGVRAWGDSSARLSRPSRGRRCQIHSRAPGLRRDKIGANRASARIRLLPPYHPSFLQSFPHLTESFPYPSVPSSYVTCTVRVTWVAWCTRSTWFTCVPGVTWVPEGRGGRPVFLRG